MTNVRQAAERAARESYGRLLASLVARSGDIAAAEDALADAFVRALESWPRTGVPEAPDAWLLTTSRRLVVDAARHARVAREALPALARREETMRLAPYSLEPEGDLPDERLKMLFLCAHPAIDPAVRTPLMLQTVLGLNAERIAAAFLVSPAALAQRLVRAKTKIRDARLTFELPDEEAWGERLDDVLDSVYAAYSVGWDSLESSSDFMDLASDAVWLADQLARLAPEEPEALGLYSLLLYGESRRAARRTTDGEYVPLSEQDVSLWDRDRIDLAERTLQRTLAFARPGRFQIEAAIQSAHAARRRTCCTTCCCSSLPASGRR
jgi:RNA polymerase sigma-70 factor (ECF subfamily)